MNELGEPLRLLRMDGTWTLEMTRMVPVDKHVLKPERRRLKGADCVVRHLKEHGVPALVRETLDLIVGQDDGSDRVFALEGEHWVQTLDADGEGSGVAALAEVVSNLRGELVTMRALHEALRSRIAYLERRAAQLPAEQARPAVRPATRRDAVPASLRPGLVRSRSLTPAAEAALPVAATELSAPAVQPADGAAARIKLPVFADLVTCLKQLLGVDPELRHERGAPPAELGPFFVSRVVDAADEEVAVVLLDASAGAELGGCLLGLPPTALAEMARGELSADVMDAMNEVTNNLGGFINRANLDTRVRVRPLERYDESTLPWLAKCKATLGSTTKSGGQLWIAAR